MTAYPDIPGVMIEPAAPEMELRIALGGPVRLAGDAAERVDRAWAEMRRQNPRLHDGEVLLIERSTRSDGNGLALEARRGPFRLLAAGSRAGIVVRALGVQGLVIGRDAAGAAHVLMGRRGSEVRVYPGLWENAPSGSVEPPREPDLTAFGMSHVLGALRKEGGEELGLDIGRTRVAWVAMLEDAEAASLDVVLRQELLDPIDPARTVCASNEATRWEYADTAWVAMTKAGAWAETNERAVSPPTRALLRWAGALASTTG